MNPLIAITPETLESVLPCAGEFFAESGLDGEWNRTYWLATWRGFLARGVGVMFAGGEPVEGFAAGIISPEMVSGRMCLQEIYWFVSRPFRKGRLGVHLFDALERVAHERQCQRIAFGCMAHLSDSVGKFYARRGYRAVETHFLKTLP